jgi:hypothetical protein
MEARRFDGDQFPINCLNADFGRPIPSWLIRGDRQWFLLPDSALAPIPTMPVSLRAVDIRVSEFSIGTK